MVGWEQDVKVCPLKENGRGDFWSPVLCVFQVNRLAFPFRTPLYVQVVTSVRTPASDELHLISVYPYCGLNFNPSLLFLNRNLQIDHYFTNIRQTKHLEPNVPVCCFRFLSLRPLSFLECRALVISSFPYWFRGFPGIHATVLPWGLWRHQSRDLKEARVFTENS